MITTGQRVIARGLQLSCTVVLGLGGTKYSKEHSLETVKVLNIINPHYLGLLALMVDPQAPLSKDVAS